MPRPVAWKEIILSTGIVLCVFGHAVGLQTTTATKSDLKQESPNFNQDVAPLLYQHCSSCHRRGGAMPTLLNYPEVYEQANKIARVLVAGEMPPWKPEPGFGEFKDARVLSPGEKETFLRWISMGAPEGEKDQQKQVPTFSNEWQLGPPDLVVKMRKPFLIQAEGSDTYQCFLLSLGLKEDRPISAFEVHPGSRSVLHHSIIFVDAVGAAKAVAGDPESGYECFGGPGFPPAGTLGGWSPGARAVSFPDGVTKMLKSGSSLVMQNHYHPNGSAHEDQTSIGIYFDKKPSRQLAIGVPIVQQNIDIPPGNRNYKIGASFTAPVDLHVFAIFPHMHFLGHEMKVTAHLPSREVVPLIWIRNWDFNWQGEYFYKTPLFLPKGTQVEMEVRYDNSSGNVRNPNHPPRRVTYGDRSTDEMAVCVMEVAIDKLEDSVALQKAILQQPGVVGSESTASH